MPRADESITLPEMISSANPHFIAGRWEPGNGPVFTAQNPSTGETHWSGAAASPAEVDRAFAAARRAQKAWATRAVEERAEYLRDFARRVEARLEELAAVISLEVGKPRWEARGEVQAVAAKAELTIEAYALRCSELHLRGATTRFRPHGVVAVLGPFNFPLHLPNGHILPALLAGNCVLFKPSDKAPAAAEKLLQIWEEVGLPEGVLQLLQGGGETAQTIAGHPQLDGLFFTGSSAVGLALNRELADRPHVLLALELGGNNAAILHRGISTSEALPLVLQSAFASAGQRCNCTRRLILTESAPSDFLPALAEAAGKLRLGGPESEPEPFYGPLIRPAAVEAFLQEQKELRARGARAWLEGQAMGARGNFASPAIWEVDPALEPDEEIFAPLLKVIRVPDLPAAFAVANATRYGLAAALFSREPEDWVMAQAELRTGVLNWNQPTTAASSAAPFGGLGLSGNHRPSAYFAVDYCAYPVASLETPQPPPGPWPPGLMDPSGK